METFEVTPINGRKSFYGKAKVVTENNVSNLYSCDTLVASYDHQNNNMTVNGWYSATTATHINAFLDFYGFDTCTKKELENFNNA